MSLSSAMNMAVSGLAASTRRADVVSTNIANAATAGYVTRSATVSSVVAGGQSAGVAVVSVRRDVDTVLLSERRQSQAEHGASQVVADFLSSLEAQVGVAGADGSLAARVDALDTALISATARPDSEAALSAVLTSAKSLAGAVVSASDAVQDQRSAADTSIADQVGTLNTALTRVSDLNTRIKVESLAGRDVGALEDLRQATIDTIATIVPLREIRRDNGMVALYTPAGAALVDGAASTFSFDAAGAVTADSTLQNGALSALRLNGTVMGTGADSLLAGGTLIAQFRIRDELGPEAQTRLDTFAQELVTRFQSSAVDPTLGATDAGLFTDGGAAFSDAAGLAARLSVNTRADPQAGGALWRLRDGLNAAAAGASGDTTILSAMEGTLTEARVAASSSTGARQSVSSFAAGVSAAISGQRITAEDTASFQAARRTALETQEAATGVDTDQQLQDLMQIQQAYGANARVLQVLDDMLGRLMEI